MLNDKLLQDLSSLRRQIHNFPELSGKEYNTSKRLKTFISGFNPDKIIDLANTSFAVIFDSGKPGSAVLFRSELDALPIMEVNDIPYRSAEKNISHKCGHDGHMSILAGLGALVSQNRPQAGKVILLFQEAEETGEGGAAVAGDPKFKSLKPDYVFALHNLPGFPLGSVILKKGSFASASRGMTVKLKGKDAHAAEPERAVSPLEALITLAQELRRLPAKTNGFSLVTIINMILGEKAFGTTPGRGEISATLRAFNNDDMELLITSAEKLVRETALSEKLKAEVSYTEIFPATENDGGPVDLVRDSATKLDLKTIDLDTPFKWSEDFGHFTSLYKGAYFGLGSGENQPNLHNPAYDFPDKLTATGVNLFYSLKEKLTG